MTLHDPPIVLLDEANASEAPATEALEQAAIDELLMRKTVLVVAHRLGTILHTARVAHMDDGRGIEVGTHTELMAAGGAYAQLVRRQFTEAVSWGCATPHGETQSHHGRTAAHSRGFALSNHPPGLG